MSSGTCNKVNTSTQVEYGLEEARSIVGQEDTAVEYISNNLSNLSLKKQSKGIRPPLVGQASSSSNDSVSLPFETRSQGSTQDRHVISPIQHNSDHNQRNDSAVHKRPSYLPNRNDFINQKPPEGSYWHINLPSQATESNHELTRVRSSSSASSVTSSRPLEWDNGADVGYNQCHVISGKILDPNMSTVERMALVSSTKLLRRSDPEGTTGGNCQQVKSSSQPKLRVKNKFGHPNAESTPLSTGTCVASDASPDTVDFISPIPYERRKDSDPEINSSESEGCDQNLHRPRPLQDENTTKSPPTFSHVKENTKQKIPLFPEMSVDNSMPNGFGKVGIGGYAVDNGINHVQCSGRENIVEHCADTHNDTEVYINSKMQQFNDELKSKLESVESLDMVHKKLSSSLENISNINNSSRSDGKIISSTLPRSQSQTDLYLEKIPDENITNSKQSKFNIVIQNLFKNKSASSSSVATVVHRKGDSPKHALVQTSVFKKQSVGTQVCDSIEDNTIKCKLFTPTAISETPHLPKSFLTQQLIKKSNYFDFNIDSSKYKNAAIDQLPAGANDNCGEREFKSNNFGTHFHNGILCKGAHKRNVFSEEHLEYSDHQNTNFTAAVNCGLDPSVSVSLIKQNQRQNGVCSANFNQRKNVSIGMIDSVESSVKSGGCGTDKQYSVTVEDRVNSFEYLPGHVYENNERQQPINSCGTSSMSIENHTSNNATPEDQNKIWGSSGGSISSTFEKDAQRGADILSDFVKGAYDNDTLLKRKLIRRVVDKLISKNHIDKKIESYHNLMKNTPWFPPRPSNPVERNAVTSPKSKVPCEFSSHSEKSGTINTSSECFIPKSADRNKCFPSFFRDDSRQKYQGELSSTSNVTPETSAKPLDRLQRSHKLTDSKSLKIKKNHGKEPSENSSTNNVLRTNNWKEPATKSEKLVEEKRKLQSESSGSHSSISQLLNMERENQLFWIRSEIEHLSNLKLLLERQEELKRGLKNCKSRQSRLSERHARRDKNRVEKEKTKMTANSASRDAVNKASPLKTKSSHPPKLNKWLKDLAAVSKANDIDLDGWVSHHYDNDVNIKSCMKRKGKHQVRQSQTKTPIEDKDYVIYDEPPISSQRKSLDLKHQKQSTATDDNPSESASMGEKDHNLRNVSDRLGPSTQVERPRQRGREPQCVCQDKCQCCIQHNKTNIDNKKKEPLGYYIIFDNPKKKEESNRGKHQSEEIGIRWPMGERKQKPAVQGRAERQSQRAGADNVSEKGKPDFDRRKYNGKISESLCSDSEFTSNDSENDKNKMNLQSKKAVFKGGAGELQYHLLHNRPSYVSRAEDRRQCIAQMQYLRELSSQNKHRLLSLTERNPPPPPPIKVQRVFSQHKMRQMTEKKYQQLSEVREKLQDKKKKERYRTNRLMAEIFKKNLQKRVLKGEVNLSNSVFVISSL